MSSPAVNTESSRHLSSLLDRVTKAIEDALGSLIDTDVLCRDGRLSLTAANKWLRKRSGPSVLVTGSLGSDYPDKSIHFLFEVSTAAILAGHMMMAPKEAIDERRGKSSISDQDLEAFGDVANVICSGAESVLREGLSVMEDAIRYVEQHGHTEGNAMAFPSGVSGF